MKASTSIDRLLPLNVAIVSILGIVMLGLGQRDLSLVVAGIVAVVVSLIVTDLKHWVRLNRVLANVAAVVAVAFSVRDFLKFDQATQLLAIANLLIYLQIVLLFQEKLLRVYWQILVLSLLQVVVGTALNMGVGFGAMMAVYLFFMLTAMMLLHIRRQALRFGRREHDAASATAADIDVASPRSTGSGPIQVLPTASSALGRRLAQTGIVRQSLSGSFVTFIVAALLFFALPRSDENVWTPVSTSDTLTGYTSTVSLHSLGSILDNDEIVMRVAFRNENDREKPYDIQGELLLRGSVLNHYSRGEWGHKSQGPLGPRTGNRSLPPKDVRLEGVLQRITIEPLSEPVVFGVYPLHRLKRATAPRGPSLGSQAYSAHQVRRPAGTASGL